MPEILFDSEFLKAGINITENDRIKFLDTGQKDSKDRWIFMVAAISGKTGNVRCEKKFSLNKTNFNAITSFYGSNSDNWLGKEMTVRVMLVQDPSGKSVRGIRLIGKDDIVNELLSEGGEEFEEDFLEKKI